MQIFLLFYLDFLIRNGMDSTNLISSASRKNWSKNFLIVGDMLINRGCFLLQQMYYHASQCYISLSLHPKGHFFASKFCINLIISIALLGFKLIMFLAVVYSRFTVSCKLKFSFLFQLMGPTQLIAYLELSGFVVLLNMFLFCLSNILFLFHFSFCIL